MKTLYRISDGGYKKEKLEFADKFYCLENYLKVFGSQGLIVFADNVKDETFARLSTYPIQLIRTNEGSSAQSWKYVAKYALQNFDLDEIVYFLEDDYLHKENAPKAIKEGLEIADYVTLYDHPDKYIDGTKGGNHLVVDGGEQTKVFLTKSSHWKQTNSTTMTFACKLQTLKDDFDIWDKYTQGSLPNDDLIFYRLQSLKKLKFKFFGKNRKLISPIPGYSTHVEKAYLSPLIDWNKV
ncbi:MAG: hypothetical protein SFY32_16855 [Bacteroidota bacterium]|nr:hypothetical protein [Bacteroidota bacterium]